jgi:hypothetical protein
MRRFLALIALGACLVGGLGALAQTPRVPTLPTWEQSVLTSPTPAGSLGAYDIHALLSPQNWEVPRGHLSIWAPYAGDPAYDTANIFWNGSQSATNAMAIEIPADVTSAQVVFANSSASPVTLTDAAIWGSSQLAPPGYTGTTPGITPYDGGGNALSYMTLLSFGNNGLDAPPPVGNWAVAPPNSTNLTTTSSTPTTSQVLQFATNSTCPANGATAVIVGSVQIINPLLLPNTTVTACVSSAGTVTMSQFPRAAVPVGTVVYFVPPGFVLPASTIAPIPTLTYSDWAPMTSYPRIDGPVMTGMAILQNGSPLAGNVQSVSATQATMTTPLGADIPAGAAIQACQIGVTNAAMTPIYQLQFATNAGIVPGLTIYPSRGGPAFWARRNIVASVSSAGGNTTATMTSPIEPNLGANSANNSSGTTFAFQASETVVAVAGSTITVSNPSLLSVGMSIYQGSVAIGVNGAAYTATIQSIAGSVVTMTAAVPATIVANMPLTFLFTTTNNLTVTTATYPSFSTTPPTVFQGMQVVGPGVDPATYVYYSGAGVLKWTHQPSSPIPSGTTLYFCHPMTTSIDSPQGQSAINFASTTYPNRLVLLRQNFASANTNYYFSALSSFLAYWANLPGTVQNQYGGQCNFGTDGVLNIAAIGASVGGCSESFPYPTVWAIRFYSPSRGVIIAYTGDSHTQGVTSTMALASYGARAAYLLSTPTLPVTPENLAWGGKTSMVYGQKAMTDIRWTHPQIVLIQHTTGNDPQNASGVASMNATALEIAAFVQSYGGLPILVSDYQRQVWGCSVEPTLQVTTRQTAEAGLTAAATTGTPVFDMPPIVGDTGTGGQGVGYFAPSMSDDCLHANDNGHATLANALVKLLRPYLRY